MHFEFLAAKHFRNLDIDLTLLPHSVVLKGANAQGKTNVLEALYLCATGRSFRYANVHELLCHDAKAGVIKARFVRQSVRHDVEIILHEQKRVIKVDGRQLQHAGCLLELLNVVAFFPDDLKIIKGSPEERRRFLDRAVANNVSNFYETSVAYQKVLKARNQILKTVSCDPHLLQAYNTQLVQLGSVIHAQRVQTLNALTPFVKQFFNTLMGEHFTLELALQNGVTSSAENFEQSFWQALERNFTKDKLLKMTTKGPHRADLTVFINAKDARSFASQGQQRVIVLAFKLAEVCMLKQKLGVAPIMLLDDVSSELDHERTKKLFTVLEQLEPQVWVTTTGTASLPLSIKNQIFTIEQGRCVESSSK